MIKPKYLYLRNAKNIFKYINKVNLFNFSKSKYISFYSLIINKNPIKNLHILILKIFLLKIEIKANRILQIKTTTIQKIQILHLLIILIQKTKANIHLEEIRNFLKAKE
jgi:hypothetical protein